MKTKIRSLSLAILTGLALIVLSLGVFFGVGKPVSAKAVQGTVNATWQEIIDNNANFTLEADETLDQTVIVNKPFELNLNGKTITATTSAFKVVEGGQLTVKNGTIKADQVGSDAFTVISADENNPAILTLCEDLTVTAGDCCVVVKGNAVLNTSANLTSDAGYATIQGNGTPTYWGTEINVTGGSVYNSADLAIYHPQDGVLNVSGGEIKGTTGIEMRAGMLNVTGGTITATATEVTAQANGNGSTVTGAAIAVSRYNQAESTLKVNVTGGTLVGAAKLYETDVTGAEVKTSLEITVAESVGVTFNNAVAQIGNTYYDTLEAAFEVGGTVELLKDVTLTSALEIDKEFILNGNDKTITVVGKGLRLFADATINNVTINNASSAGRCIDTRTNVTVDLNNVTLNTTSSGNNQPITVGGTTDGTVINVKNSEINAGRAGYAIITFVECEVNVENTKITGYNAVYVKTGSENSVITVKDSEISTKNDTEDPSNSFGAFVFETSETVELNLNNVKAELSTTGATAQCLIGYASGADKVKVTASDLQVEATTDNIYLVSDSDADNNTVEISSGTFNVPVDSKYVTTAILYKEDGTAYVAEASEIENNTNAVAKVGDTYYATLEQAFAVGGTIELLKDVTLMEKVSDAVNANINIEKEVTLKGNGHKITGTVAKSVFYVSANATFKDVTIESAVNQARCINTREKVTVDLNNVTLNTTSSGNNQPITVSGSTDGTVINVKNSEINAGRAGYAIITFVQSTINVENTEITGYNAVYVKAGSEHSVITVKDDSKISTNCDTEDPSNSFGAFVFEAGNVELKLNSVEAELSTTGTTPQALVLNNANVENVKVTAFELTVKATSNYVNLVSGFEATNNTLAISSGTFNVPVDSKYVTTSILYKEDGTAYVANANDIVNNTNAVAQIGNVYYDTLQAAFAIGGTVELLKDVTLTSALEIDKEFILNGNDKTITVVEKGLRLFADATINNVTINNASSAGRCIDTRTNVTVDLNNVTLNTTSSGNNQPITVGGSTDGTVINVKDSEINAGRAGYAIITFVECEVNVENTKITGYNAVYVKAGSEHSVVTVKDSEISTNCDSEDESNSFGAFVFETAETVELNLNNVEAELSTTGTTPQCLIGYASGADKVKVTASDLKVVAKTENIHLVSDSAADNNTVEISSGTFNVPVDSKYVTTAILYKEDGTAYVANANDIVNNTNVEACVNGNVYYEVIEDALAAAIDGDVITLLKNVELTDKWVVDVDVTLNLNDCTLTLPALGNYAVVINDKLTINGNGDVVIKGIYGFGLSTACTGGLTINSGNFTQEGDYYLIGAWNGKVEINGGTFTAPYCVVNSFEYAGAANANVVLNGGNYNVNEDGFALLGHNFTVDETNCTFNYPIAAVKAGDNYCASMEDAFVEVEDGETITLLKDVEVFKQLTVDKNITWDLNGYTLTLPVWDNYAVLIKDTLTISGDGNVIVNGDFGFGLSTACTGGLTINGGNFVQENGVYLIGAWNGTVEINGGTFESAYCVVNSFEYGGVAKANVELNGGNYYVNEDGFALLGHNFTVEEEKCYFNQGAPAPVVAGDKYCNSLEMAFDIAEDGDVITLYKDVELASMVTVDKELTLDLNGYTLNATAEKAFSVVAGGNLTVDNGFVSAAGYAFRMDNTASGAEAVLTLGEKLSVVANYCCVFIKGNSVLNTSAYYMETLEEFATISGNGNAGNEGTTINVYGGVIYRNDDLAIYHPQVGTLNVYGGEIVGTTGIEMRAGTLNIEGGVMAATAEVLTAFANGSGSTVTGAAVAISQHSTEKEIIVNITGGEFYGLAALYEVEVEEEPTDVTMLVEGGTFNGEVYSENVTGFVVNGTFNYGVENKYLASGVAFYNGLIVTVQQYAYNMKVELAKTIESYKTTYTYSDTAIERLDEILANAESAIDSLFTLKASAVDEVYKAAMEAVEEILTVSEWNNATFNAQLQINQYAAIKGVDTVVANFDDAATQEEINGVVSGAMMDIDTAFAAKEAAFEAYKLAAVAELEADPNAAYLTGGMIAAIYAATTETEVDKAVAVAQNEMAVIAANTQALADFETELDSTLSTLKAGIEGEIKALKEALVGTAVNTDTLEERLTALLNGLDNDIEAAKGEVNGKIDASQGVVTDAITAAKNEVNGKIKEVKDETAEILATVKANATAIAALSDKLDTMKADMLNELKTKIETEIKALKDALIGTTTDTLENRLMAKFTALSAELAQTEIDLGVAITNAKDAVNSKIEASQGVVTAAITTTETNVKTAITAAKDEVNGKIAEVKAETASILTIVNENKAAIADAKSTLNTAITDAVTALKADLAAKVAPLATTAQLTAAQNKILTDLAAEIAASEAALNALVSEGLEGLETKVASTTASLTDQIEATEKTLNNAINTKTTALQAAMNVAIEELTATVEEGEDADMDMIIVVLNAVAIVIGLAIVIILVIKLKNKKEKKGAYHHVVATCLPIQDEKEGLKQVNCNKCGATLNVKGDCGAYMCPVCRTMFRVQVNKKSVKK